MDAGQGIATDQPPGDSIELLIDPLGVGLLRGVVATEADKIAIGQKVVNELGLPKVLNNLETREAMNAAAGEPNAAAPAKALAGDVPPPPPTPVGAVSEAASDELVIHPQPKLSRLERIKKAIERIPALEKETIRVSERQGVATIKADLPSAFEAMLIYRAVQKTPGVDQIVDQTQFPVPDDDHPNPLLAKGASEDVEPYLSHQVQRQLGEMAHVEGVRMNGGRLSVVVSLESPDDKDRVAAALRSMPLLRGFQVEPTFKSN